MPSINDKLTYVGSQGSITTLSAPGKAIGATSINIGSTANWPAVGQAVYFAIRTVNPTLITSTNLSGQVTGTYTEWKGIVATNSITGLVLQSGSTDQVYTAGTNTQVLITVGAPRENAIVDWGLVHADQTGALLPAAVQTALGTGNLSNTGYNALGFTPNTVTNNGNRSTTMVFNGTDLTGVLSPGMRIRTTRATPTNTYMGGALNGTSQYFTKVTPTGTLSTVTDNFTIMGFASLTAYGTTGCIAARADATNANGLYLLVNNSGQPYVQIGSGGSANIRYVQAYQSLPLNKKTHVAATWAAGVVNIYLDGFSVPTTAAITGGTAPTTAGTGGDFSIGRYGANNGGYFPGYLSNVAVFNAVLSLATIQQYGTYKLLGTETNCIGAWSLDNTLVDQFGANTLNAGGIASFSNIAPFATDGNNVATGNFDFGIVQRVTFSTNTTVVVQAPEGCAFTTVASGISAVVYSSQKVPFGFPAQRGKWVVDTLLMTSMTTAASTSLTSINSTQLQLPAGKWAITWRGNIYVDRGTTADQGVTATLSTSTTIETYKSLTTYMSLTLSSLTSNIFLNVPMGASENNIETTTLTPFYLLVKATTASGTMGINNSNTPTVITAENALL